LSGLYYIQTDGVSLVQTEEASAIRFGRDAEERRRSARRRERR
jgi:hypothetical protein